MNVRELRCPGCSAPVDASGGVVSRCRYCGASLTFDGSAPAGFAARATRLLLDDAGRNKIAVIKVVVQHTRLGLKEAKDLVERAPCLVAEWDDAQRVESFRQDLARAGARTR